MKAKKENDTLIAESRLYVAPAEQGLIVSYDCKCGYSSDKLTPIHIDKRDDIYKLHCVNCERLLITDCIIRG